MIESRVGSCLTCGLRRVCLPRELESEEVCRLAESVVGVPFHPPGTVLFGEGETMDGLHMVRGGLVATYQSDATGESKVAELLGPGSVLGVDGLETGRHPATAVTLEGLETRFLSREALDRLAREQPGLERGLLRIGSQVLNRKQALWALRRSATSGQAVKRLCLAVATGYASEGLGRSEVPWLTDLSLPREAVRSILDLTDGELEGALAEEPLRGHVHLDGERLLVPDIGGLHRAAGGQIPPS